MTEHNKKFNLIIAGVGGQGSVLASHIVAEAAVVKGFKTRVGETFGASQRGGKVHSHVRFGEDVYGPLCSEESLDILLGLEPNETLRIAVNYVGIDTLIITNTSPIRSMDAYIGADTYPEVEEIIEGLLKLSKRVISFDATKIAVEIGNERTMNVVMLGALVATGRLPYEKDLLRSAIVRRVPERTVEVNMRAFDSGFEKFNSLIARAKNLDRKNV